jgi:deoxyribodipyrimidine photo-lyase
MSATVLIWHRADLRLADHPALTAAVTEGALVVPVFIWAPEEEEPWHPGAASRWWLHESLKALDAELRSAGSGLVLRRGPSLDALRSLLKETGARSVYWCRRYEPAAMARDGRVQADLHRSGYVTRTFGGALLFEPCEICTQQGRPFQVFTPFWRACRQRPEPAPPAPAPSVIAGPKQLPASASLVELGLYPTPDWAGGLRANWRPGEAGARAELARFVDSSLARYAADRDRPDRPGTSRLSPHLHFGEISVRQVWSALRRQANPAGAAEAYLRQLGWREFAHHLLYHFPDTPQRPWRERFANWPAQNDATRLRAWQTGRTGYPIVDAGMRELWHTGWMHNRVRMIVASFLVKDLLIPWQVGAKWFWDTLVDADLANNTLGWQWSAGCGADASPYVRIFNPVTQGRKFDPDGVYVRRWLPELSRLPRRWLHRPWEAPAAVRTDAGVELGLTYPHPIVNHAQARKQALAAMSEARA